MNLNTNPRHFKHMSFVDKDFDMHSYLMIPCNSISFSTQDIADDAMLYNGFNRVNDSNFYFKIQDELILCIIISVFKEQIYIETKYRFYNTERLLEFITGSDSNVQDALSFLTHDYKFNNGLISDSIPYHEHFLCEAIKNTFDMLTYYKIKRSFYVIETKWAKNVSEFEYIDIDSNTDKPRLNQFHFNGDKLIDCYVFFNKQKLSIHKLSDVINLGDINRNNFSTISASLTKEQVDIIKMMLV